MIFPELLMMVMVCSNGILSSPQPAISSDTAEGFVIESMRRGGRVKERSSFRPLNSEVPEYMGRWAGWAMQASMGHTRSLLNLPAAKPRWAPSSACTFRCEVANVGCQAPN